MSQSTMLTARQKAAEINVSEETLRRWRRLGQGPAFKKFAPQTIRYWPEPEQTDADPAKRGAAS